MTEIHVGQVYRHKWGNVYKVDMIATFTNSSETLVIYHDTKDTSLVWAKSLPEFMNGDYELIEVEK